MSPASKLFHPSISPTSYQLTPTTALRILVFAFLFPPLRILKFLLAYVHVHIQNLMALIVNPITPHPTPLDEKVDLGYGKGTAEAEPAEAVAAEPEPEPESWARLRRLGGITLTVTVSVGAVKLLVVTVTIVALTLWVPFYPSARSFFALFDRLCRTGISSGGKSGLVVDIRVGP